MESQENLTHEKMLQKCKDNYQAETAFNLYVYLCAVLNLEFVNWHYDSVLQMIVMEVQTAEHQPPQLIVPLYHTFHPTLKWNRSVISHMEEKHPGANVVVAFSSSDQKFVMYRISNGLKMPKNLELKDLLKTSTDTDD